MRTLSRIIALAVLASLIALLGVPAATADGTGKGHRGDGGTRTYTVKATNVTDSQILTPVVFAAHTQRGDIFDLGTATSPELREIAENGNLAPLVQALKSAKGVASSGIGAGDAGPLLPGHQRMFELRAPHWAGLLSTAQMVVCTNDGFTGLDALRLPRHKGETVRVYVYAWDAGTEKNTNALGDFVPPCSNGATGTTASNPALAEGGVIAPHPGVDGEAAAAGFGFDPDSPVAVYEVTRAS